MLFLGRRRFLFLPSTGYTPDETKKKVSLFMTGKTLEMIHFIPITLKVVAMGNQRYMVTAFFRKVFFNLM